ncbi:EamA family transporter [Jeongeupia naejangsanensis]|uniref:EamA family transporter n=1 Tax=Jeongeupia naejangsanensis TaxID=613195 RepID=A0ABS2BK33_9NEIS|nr:EamA family transporter [Jeongeupia naejangsanensis]MBM3115189.1 EamA family transporter [Jeongeupia naejangsanensis]
MAEQECAIHPDIVPFRVCAFAAAMNWTKVNVMKFRDVLAAILVTGVWGVNFSIIKLGLNTLDPFVLAGLRFLFCAIPAVFFIRKPDVPMKVVALYGLIFGVGLWGMVNLGVRLGASAGVSSLVLQFSAFLTIFMGYVFLKEPIGRQKLAGFSMALIGLIVIMSLTDGSVTPLGLAMVLFGAVSWSLANIVMKKSRTKNVFGFLVWACLFAPLPLFVMAYLAGGARVYANFGDNLNAIAVFSVLFQAYPTTLIGYWVWNSLLSKYPVSSVAPLSLLVPVFGFAGSAVIFGEVIGSEKIAASLLILSGLTVALYGDKVKRLFTRTSTA